MALTKEKLLELLDNGDILLSDIRIGVEGNDAQTEMDAKKNRDTLLWTNPSPSSAFAAQSIAVAGTGFDYYEIIFVASSTSYNQHIGHLIVPIGGKGYFGFAGTSAATIRSRAIGPTSTTTVGFLTGYLGTTANTTVCIPTMIRGGNW